MEFVHIVTWFFDDAQIQWPKESNHEQVSKQQPGAHTNHTLAKNKNNHHKNKTKDKSSISTIAYTVNNTNKLFDLLDEQTKIMKGNPIWQTMYISAGNDAILLLNVCTPRRATKNINTVFKKTEIIRVINMEYKKNNIAID